MVQSSSSLSQWQTALVAPFRNAFLWLQACRVCLPRVARCSIAVQVTCCLMGRANCVVEMMLFGPASLRCGNVAEKKKSIYYCMEFPVIWPTVIYLSDRLYDEKHWLCMYVCMNCMYEMSDGLYPSSNSLSYFYYFTGPCSEIFHFLYTKYTNVYVTFSGWMFVFNWRPDTH